MNVSDLQTRINYRRRDATESFISNDEILAYLNEGNRKVTSYYEFDWNKTSASFTYTTGYNRYKLSAFAPDFDETINLYYSSTHLFEPVSPKQFYAISANNVDIFAIDNQDLLVKSVAGTGTLNLDYYSNYTAQTSAGYWLQNLSSTTDKPLMPEQFQDCLVEYGGAMCHYKEGMYDDGDREMARFEKILKQMQAKVPSKKKHYSKRMLSVVGGNYSSAINLKSDPLSQI